MSTNLFTSESARSRAAAAKGSGPPQWWIVGRGRWRWITIGLEIVVAWTLVLGLLIGLGLLITHPLKSSLGEIDHRLALWIEDQRTPTLTTLAEIGGTGGDTITIVIMAVCVAAAAWVWTRSARPAVFLLVGLFGQALLYYYAANVVSRPRPPVKLLDYGLDPTRSYPSGHVSTAVTFFGGCAVLLWIYGARRWHPLAGLLLLVPPIVGISRLYQGVHYLTDAVASLIVVPLWVAVMAALVLTSRVDSR